MDKMTNSRRTKSNLQAPIPAAVLALVLLAASGAAFAAERKLAFPVEGVVQEVLVRSGQALKAGAAVARLDPRPLAARKSAADAGLKAAEARLKFAVQNRGRAKQLFDDLSTSAEELEKADIALINARADRAGAKAEAGIAAWRLAHATLRAPVAGTVAAVPGYAGMVVNPAAEITPVVILTTP